MTVKKYIGYIFISIIILINIYNFYDIISTLGFVSFCCAILPLIGFMLGFFNCKVNQQLNKNKIIIYDHKSLYLM